MRAFVRAHPLSTYLFLAFALSWWPWPFRLMNPQSAPMLPWGPLIGSLFVVGVAYGSPGLARLARATFRWRVHPKWYLLAFGLPLALWGVPAAIVAASGSPPDFQLLADFVLWPVTFLTLGILQGPLTEEPGWRGLALPLMLKRWSPLVASLALGAVWLAWHLPLMIGDTSGQRPLVPYTVFILGLSVLLTGVYLGTRGSVFVAILLHAAMNATASHVMPAFSPAARDTIWLIFAGLMLAVAAIVALMPSFRHPDLRDLDSAPDADGRAAVIQRESTA